jgi:hypothetical protein
MPFNLPVMNTGAGAPQVEDGLALARFDDLVLKPHPDWAGTDKFGHEDDGQRFHFLFTVLDEDYRVVYDEGDPVEIEAVTRTATGEKSNFFAVLSGLLTPKELAAYQAATAEDPFDGSDLPGRIVNVKIAHNKKNWPFIEAVISVAKKQKVAG